MKEKVTKRWPPAGGAVSIKGGGLYPFTAVEEKSGSPLRKERSDRLQTLCLGETRVEEEKRGSHHRGCCPLYLQTRAPRNRLFITILVEGKSHRINRKEGQKGITVLRREPCSFWQTLKNMRTAWGSRSFIVWGNRGKLLGERPPPEGRSERNPKLTSWGGALVPPLEGEKSPSFSSCKGVKRGRGKDT